MDHAVGRMNMFEIGKGDNNANSTKTLRMVFNLSTLLYIKANPKRDQDSRTFQISGHFIQAYQRAHPGDQVITLDLYEEGIKPLTTEEVLLTHAHEPSDHPFLCYAKQFHAADKYVFAAPLWNLGSPAILKAYIDHIMIVGINFSYTEVGPKGLCTMKKALHITSRGGFYSEGPFAAYEMADRYLRTVLGFLGICEIETIAAEGLDIQGADVGSIVEQAKTRAAEIAKSF